MKSIETNVLILIILEYIYIAIMLQLLWMTLKS